MPYVLMGNSIDLNKRILVYGIEKVGIKTPKLPIVARKNLIEFEEMNTSKKFYEYDGVILFQRIFLHRESELTKRRKELQVLRQQGGFICLIMYTGMEQDDARSDDLADFILRRDGIRLKNYRISITNLDCYRDEFREFLRYFGVANIGFLFDKESPDIRYISKFRSHEVTGMILYGDIFIIPSIIPDNNQSEIEKYFTLLAEALIRCEMKISVEIPDWIEKIRFDEELVLIESKERGLREISKIGDSLETYNKFKTILMFDGDMLIESVLRVFNEGFGIKAKNEDELREDVQLFDGEDIAILCEVKGTNKGVKREHINQADSHRERKGCAGDFPSILLINTNISASQSLEDKDMEVAQEQVKHAVHIKVLIIRTLDLLGLLRLFFKKTISKEDILLLLKSKYGWLRVNEDNWEVRVE